MLYEKIKTDRLNAMKAKDENRKRILSVLVGEIDRCRGTKELSDDVVIASVKKLVKAAKDTIQMVGPDASTTSDLVVLEAYLPKELSESDIRNIVIGLKGIHGDNIGAIMKTAKSVPGINLGIVSSILKSL
jgi:uncharacterized protein YqeY